LVSNPPYVPRDADLPPDVRAEPSSAVRAGLCGDEILHRLAAEAPGWLAPTGALALEVGTGEQATALLDDLEGFASSGIREDQNGLPRVVWAHR
jgi:release factor glutamine methyltransferase